MYDNNKKEKIVCILKNIKVFYQQMAVWIFIEVVTMVVYIVVQEVNAIKWIMNLPILKLKPIVIWFLINNYPKKETPYCIVEKELLNMRRCLEVINKYNCGVRILTKSTLLLRDLNLIKK